MPFIQYPTLRYHEGDEFELTCPMTYISKEYDCYIVVPKGFTTDLASIPRIFHPLLPVVDRHANAAIVHDYLCRLEGKYTWQRIKYEFTRYDVDKIFLYAMIELGVPRWKRNLMYWAVRAYGLTFQRF